MWLAILVGVIAIMMLVVIHMLNDHHRHLVDIIMLIGAEQMERADERLRAAREADNDVF